MKEIDLTSLLFRLADIGITDTEEYFHDGDLFTRTVE